MSKRRPRSPEQQQEDLRRLWQNDFDYVQKGFYHYRVEGVADFWPSSSRWLFLDGTADGYGVSDLIGWLKTWREEEMQREAREAANPPAPVELSWKDYARGRR